MFVLEIHTGGAAFEGETAGELARLLRFAAKQVEDLAEIGMLDRTGNRPAALLDVNGNTVGAWTLAEEVAV